LIRTIAGRLPPLAIVEHIGRRSGRVYRTPVLAFRAGDAWVIALTYGSDTDWVRNVLGACGCTLEHGGNRLALRTPRVIVADAVPHGLPGPVRVALRALRVTEYLFFSPA
jgi:deazaflavin-dependent oxidoreductase (nitroreductase family)